MKKISRRSFVKAGLIGGAAGSAPILVHGSRYLPALNPTPSEIKGPFYPVIAQKDKDFDLTRVEGKSKIAEGKIIVIEGKILDTNGMSVADASVDIWQANAAGRYNHPHDHSNAPVDTNFQGWAIVPSGENGDFRFKTIYPGTYPAAEAWTRPPHIHFKVTKRGYVELITQMYFPDHELNEKDLLLQRKGTKDQKLMIASRTGDAPESYKYNIVIQKV